MANEAAIDAWLKVLETQRGRHGGPGCPRRPLHPGGALERRDRVLRAQGPGARGPRVEDRRAHAGGLDLGGAPRGQGPGLGRVPRDPGERPDARAELRGPRGDLSATPRIGTRWELLFNRAEVFEDRETKVETLQRPRRKVFEENLGTIKTWPSRRCRPRSTSTTPTRRPSRELERLATQAGKWSELLNEYNGLVSQIEDPIERCELWVKIGRWYGEHLDRPDYGIQSLEKALELNSGERLGAAGAGELLSTVTRSLERAGRDVGSDRAAGAGPVEAVRDAAARWPRFRRSSLATSTASVESLPAGARARERHDSWPSTR